MLVEIQIPLNPIGGKAEAAGGNVPVDPGIGAGLEPAEHA